MSEQNETDPGTGKMMLKLGMFSAGKKFPHSGEDVSGSSRSLK